MNGIIPNCCTFIVENVVVFNKTRLLRPLEYYKEETAVTIISLKRHYVTFQI